MSNNYHKVLNVRELTDSTFVLEIERKNMAFEPGQHILLGKAGDIHHREYSIYSGVDDERLEVLVKEVDNGEVSKKLKKLIPGDEVEIQGPLGFFTIDEDFLTDHNPFLFVASGTGISPFHSMVRSIKDLNYKVLHGVRFGEETYENKDYDPNRYISCVTRDEKGKFHGRVTEYIRQHDFDPQTHCFLCGNFEMIRDAMDLLEEKGIAQDHLHAEVYF
jgi:ferredoxin/flavodoxin---NADP+ reductase